MIGPDFNNLCRIVKERSGLHLTGNRMPMVASRLAPIAQRLGHRSVQEFLARLRFESSEDIWAQIIDALTTYETSFFRDPAQFDALRRILLPDLMRKRADERRIRILSVACSHGQEPYTLAMLATGMNLPEKGWRVEITATDNSASALARAKRAHYSQFELRRGLDEAMIARYFMRDDTDYALKAPLRNMVEFRKHNVLDGPDDLGQFDIVFCRNVLFYFDTQTKAAALARLQPLTAHDGYLLMASSETNIGEAHGLVPHGKQRGVFRMPANKTVPRFARAMTA